MNEDNCARLEKIQGGVDLINERLKHANELQNERYEATRKEIDGLKAADSDLGSRITAQGQELGGRLGSLEDERIERTTERRSVITFGRAIIWLSGLIPGGMIGAALLRLLAG